MTERFADNNAYVGDYEADLAYVEAAKTAANPTIVLDMSSPLVEQLAGKADEYARRLEVSRNAFAKSKFARTRFKLHILETVLQTGQADYVSMYESMQATSMFDEPLIRQGIYDSLTWRRMKVSNSEGRSFTEQELGVEAATMARDAFLTVKGYAEGRAHLVHGGTGLRPAN